MMNRRLFKHVLSISKIIARRTSTKLHVTVVDDTPFVIKQYNKKKRRFFYSRDKQILSDNMHF